ncbi:hypothetical protein [Telmatospirillum sp.]|uniref:hypothetical protein n=1 Tax=Telmatospirillum sp. TaxID=2079197 RepID=UPI00284289B0|nr:hypothetical protein [Telmatospirillum sp.]MDR3435388.1 hypothetical protein [Telmatospirillum sp.]
MLFVLSSRTSSRSLLITTLTLDEMAGYEDKMGEVTKISRLTFAPVTAFHFKCRLGDIENAPCGRKFKPSEKMPPASPEGRRCTAPCRDGDLLGSLPKRFSDRKNS